MNWYGITIPWQLAFTAPLVRSTPAGPHTLATDNDYEQLYETFVRASDTGQADIYWGGDVDADPTEGQPEEQYDPSDPRMNQGPIGIQCWFRREVIMRPFASEGNNVIRFGDEFEAKLSRSPGAAMGGLIMFGVVRFEHAAETNFNITMDDDDSEEILGLLMSGDYSRIQHIAQGDTSARGDFLRTILWGGDHYVEADTLKGPAAKATVKAVYKISSPISKFST